MARLSPLVYGGLLPDGNVNQKLVMQGWCWWYRKYVPGDTVLKG
jgi:micrococcal nuclease